MNKFTKQDKCKVHKDIKDMNCEDCQKDIAYIIWKRLS